jgi:hypothetical protein
VRTLYCWLIGGCTALFGCSEREHLIWPEMEVESAAADPQRAPPSDEAAAESAQGAPSPEQPAAGSEFVEVVGAEFARGAAPAVNAATGLPKIVDLTGPSAVTNGSTATLRVSLDPAVPVPLFVVSVEGDLGYHTVAGTDVDADGIAEIEVQIRAGARGSSIVISVAPTDGAGQVGAYRQLTLPLVESGVGDVKITLSFEPIHDLDLHVVEPDGTEISFLQPLSASGGRLDLDSGSNCRPGAVNAENIFWPSGAAPPGQYRVTVRNFEQCDPGAIDFSVRVENGARVDTYRNTFSDRSEGTAIEVTTFMH